MGRQVHSPEFKREAAKLAEQEMGGGLHLSLDG